MRRHFQLGSICFLLVTIVSCLETCPEDLECCSSAAPLRTRSLFSRQETCPSNQKKCCEQEGTKVTVTPSSTILQCGKSTETQSTVTFDVASCPQDTAESCLHVQYQSVGNTPAYQYNNVHLGLYSSQVTKFIPPGKLNFNSYCALSDDKYTADCWVPLADINAKLSLGGSILCENDEGTQLWAVAHVDYLGDSTAGISGNTCYGGSVEVGGANWAKQLQLTFTCSTECVKWCCCPPQSSGVWCDLGTAYGYVSETASPTFESLGIQQFGCNSWVRFRRTCHNCWHQLISLY